MTKTGNKIAIVITFITTMAVMTGAASANPNPENLENPMAFEQSSASGAIISNGLIQLGVNEQGHLNVPGGTRSSGSGTTYVGLRFLPTNAEAIAPGCLCEAGALQMH